MSQHDPRGLTTGGDLTEGHQRLSGVGSKQKFAVAVAVLPQPTICHYANLQKGLLEAERLKLSDNRPEPIIQIRLAI